MRKFYVAVVLMLISVVGMKAQDTTATLKLGHINSQQLMAVMPETKQKQAEFETYAKTMNQSLESLQVEFNVKYKAYLDSSQQMPEPVRQSKELELEGLQKRIQAFQEKAQQDLGKKRQELFGPVMEKAQNAIKEVGKEEGFYYIFDVTVGSIIFASDNSQDVMPLVKKKLGIQ